MSNDQNGNGDKTPKETELLVPFVANETASDEEKARVAADAESDASLADDLAAAEKMRAAMKARGPVASPGEFGLARLRRDITALQQGRENNKAGPVPDSSNVTPFHPRAKTDEKPGGNDRAGFWRGAAGIAIAACLVLAVFATMQVTGPGVPGGPSQQLAGSGQAAGAQLTVAFQPDASEAEMRALLTELDMVIVDGPSALGLYRVAPNDPEADEQALMARLRAATSVVESVEQD